MENKSRPPVTVITMLESLTFLTLFFLLFYSQCYLILFVLSSYSNCQPKYISTIKINVKKKRHLHCSSKSNQRLMLISIILFDTLLSKLCLS